MSMMSTQTVAVVRRRRGLAMLAAAAYAWVAGHFTTFTWPAAVATFVPGVVGLSASLRRRRRPVVVPRRATAGWTAWALVLGAIVALEAYGFFAGSSTHGHPTVSNIVNHALHTDETRALAFFGWLAFGSWLLRR
jgi:hypothetical protein